MTSESEMIEAFRRGERVRGKFSIHSQALEIGIHACIWRPIVCGTDSDGRDRDIVECARCGKQRETACNFDDDFA